MDSSLSREDCECAICFEIILSCEAEGVRLFNCTHRVHAWCAQQLVSSAHGSTCPSCRAPTIPGNVGVVRQHRTGRDVEEHSNFRLEEGRHSTPVYFENLATRKKIMFIKKAFVHASADNIKLADLVESINSFFVHEGLEVITKLVLLHELYAMASCVRATDTAFIEIKTPSPHVVFLDSEAVKYVAAWEKRKLDVAMEEQKRQEQADKMVSEEARLNREHRAGLERRIAELRAAARARTVQSVQALNKCDKRKQTQHGGNEASTSSSASDGNVSKPVLSPAEEFSLLCGRVCKPIVASNNQTNKRFRSSNASIAVDHTSATCNNGIRAPVVPDPESELELVSNISSTSSSSSSYSDSDSSSSSSDEHCQTKGLKCEQTPHTGSVAVAMPRRNLRKRTLEEQIKMVLPAINCTGRWSVT